MKRPLRIGITGGIGSGKSAVCRLFALWGAPVYDSDARARALSDGPLVAAITELLGPGAYRDGRQDRKFVASKVFKDQELLASLEAIVHPAVGEDFERWADAQSAPYVILESAILFESGFDRRVDRTVAITAPDEVRIARVVARDGCDAASVRARMATQADHSAAADYVIVNDGRASLIDQVARLHALLSGENSSADGR